LPNIFLSAMHVCLIAYIQARPQADRHTDRQAGRRTNKQTGCFLCYTVVKLCMFFFLISSSMLSESNKHWLNSTRSIWRKGQRRRRKRRKRKKRKRN